MVWTSGAVSYTNLDVYKRQAQGFHGFTLHSYLLCIGRQSVTASCQHHAEWVGQGTGEQGTQVCEVCGWLPDSVQKQEKRREDDGKHCAIHHRKTVNPMFFLMGVICVPLYRLSLIHILKAGVMEDGGFHAAAEGVPQGGLCKAQHRPPYAKQNTMQRMYCFSL